jgi:hypothetical protein
MHSIERVVYQLPYFVKNIPVRDRSKYIFDFLNQPGFSYIATDHSSFEAHMTGEVMRACEIQLYDYMVQSLPQRRLIMHHIANALPKKNRCHFKGFDIEVPGSRMSGDMCTSLGNGFTNLMVMLFLLNKKGLSPATVRGVVEGDDGLFAIPNAGVCPTVGEFKQLGFDIKLQRSSHIGEAGFCQMFFHEDVRENIADPAKIIAKFGWSDSCIAHGKQNKRLGLLRAKSFSLLFELPFCPVVRSLALYGLRVTRGIRLRFSEHNTWHTQVLKAHLDKLNMESILCNRVPRENRELVANLFNISVKRQLELEHYFDSQNVLRPVPLHLVADLFPNQWVSAFRYTMRSQQGPRGLSA